MSLYECLSRRLNPGSEAEPKGERERGMGWKKWELMSIRLQEQSNSNWEPAMSGFSEDQEEESSCFFACRKEGFFPS